MNQMLPVSFIEYYLKRYVLPNDIILDVGCGPALYRNSTPAKYIGLDITDEPYNEHVNRDVDIIASALEIPLEDNSIDLIMCKSTFYQVSDPEKALLEFKRVLKSGGRLILFDYNRRTQKRLQIVENIQFERPCWTQWQLKSLVKKAGFNNTELLVAHDAEVNTLIKLLRLFYQEYRGQWAIVTGVK